MFHGRLERIGHRPLVKQLDTSGGIRDLGQQINFGGDIVPIIKHGDGPIEEGTPPGVEVRELVNAAQGSESLNVGVVTIYPSTRVPRHIHANTEQAVVVLEGKLTVILGKNRHALEAGDAALIPAGGTHGYVNASAEPARILVVYPTHEVEQVITSIEHSSGYQSEAGLRGNLSPDGSYTGGTR